MLARHLKTLLRYEELRWMVNRHNLSPRGEKENQPLYIFETGYPFLPFSTEVTHTN
jgi:hypothetical protein